MIDNPDYANSSIRLIVFRALKSYSTIDLLELLSDNDVIVRSAAARELQVRGEGSSLEYILSLCKDDRWFVREIAAFTLGQLGTPNLPFRSEALPKLMVLARDASAAVRSAAIAALGSMRSNESWDILIKSSKDEDSEVRSMAALALGRLKPTATILSRLHDLTLDPVEEVREYAKLGIEISEAGE